MQRVGPIVPPSGIPKSPDVRARWLNMESAVAWWAAREQGIEIDEIMDIDIPMREVVRYKGQRVRISEEIGATCERILRDWRDVRLEQDPRERGAR